MGQASISEVTAHDGQELALCLHLTDGHMVPVPDNKESIGIILHGTSKHEPRYSRSQAPLLEPNQASEISESPTVTLAAPSRTQALLKGVPRLALNPYMTAPPLWQPVLACGMARGSSLLLTSRGHTRDSSQLRLTFMGFSWCLPPGA